MSHLEMRKTSEPTCSQCGMKRPSSAIPEELILEVANDVDKKTLMLSRNADQWIFTFAKSLIERLEHESRDRSN